ncbi:hypothetical protein [Tenacibaculum singaporense]|uniref:Uncharacterized protein n=1 Tax=Tenacibaculum singaporense TaxID=2358479 RepID=A0A3Q8RSS2_9FLAO|nr:hypothetical protein [Tenacibaculum singaporense]AZJ36649.1 hypothetical protein D6T69_14350 [Tenacibaculum singaporense]
MTLIVFIVHLFSWFFISRNGIKKSETGKIFISKLDENTITFLKWRAISNVRTDLKKMSTLFGVISIGGIIINGILTYFKIEPGIYFLSSILLSLLFWISLKWGTNKRKETLDWFKYLGLIIISPWLFYLLDSMSEPNSPKLLIHFGTILNPIGIDLTSNIQIAISLTIILSIGMLFITLFWFIQNVIILYFFTIMLWITNRISNSLLKVKEEKITFLSYILMPITMIILYAA